MAKIIKAPNTIPYPDMVRYSIFLAGSIDMGNAVDWQKEVEDALSDKNIVILNPRRDDWDATWVQDISNDQFKQQVQWELDHLEWSDLILVYFDPNGQAPITLMELGLHARSGKMIVCCPEGYWRRGNVQVVCDMYEIPLVNTLEDLIEHAREWMFD